MPEPEGICVGSDFCQEIAGATDTAFRRVYEGDPEGRIISRGATVSLLADMSPLAQGHLLLVSNSHYVSFGQVVLDHADAVCSAIAQVFPQYGTSFGKPVILEHGSATSMDGSACITHAHLHLLPLRSVEIHDLMSSDGLVSTTIDNITGLGRFGIADLPYFYCADAETHRVYGVAQARPRQYLRSVAGRLLGMKDPEWDYALIIRKDLLRSTVKEARSWQLSLP